MGRISLCLYADEHLLVVNKPPGISVVFDRHRQESSYLWRQLWQELGPLFPVHRLDRDTTGVVLFARTAAAQRQLSAQLAHHQLEKKYHAVVAPVPPWQATAAEAPLRPEGGRPHRTLVDWELGKPSRTLFRVLVKLTEDAALVEALPVTGRRHQVRAHLAFLGCPLVGDRLYGGSLAVARPLLHARSLSFRHPLTGCWLEVTAPYPEDMARWLEEAGWPGEG